MRSSGTSHEASILSVQLLSKEIWSIHSDGTRHFRPETMACVTPPRCEREPTSAKTPLGPLEMKDRSGGLVFDTLLSAIRPVDRCCHLAVQSDKRARSSSTFAISSWRRGFLASDVSAKSRIRYRASAAASAHVVDGAARACLSNSSWRRRRLPDRPELQGGAGEFQWISERPCRDVRQVPRG